ncbi:MAG: hypothetical protein PWQ25_1820 [Deferribacteres bacterium]|nr:hypothetical protein [Deferribacteres bacterium]
MDSKGVVIPSSQVINSNGSNIRKQRRLSNYVSRNPFESGHKFQYSNGGRYSYHYQFVVIPSSQVINSNNLGEAKIVLA